MPHQITSLRKLLSLAGLMAISTISAVGSDAAIKEYISKPPALPTGNYRNLFGERGHNPAEVKQKISSAFRQLFYGDPQNQAVYFPAGTNSLGSLAYIQDIANQDVRSEGMSYGMMIAVQLDKKTEFDALWNWARSFMYHANPKHPAHGFFAWSVTTNGVANDDMPAPDGEQYFAMSLYFAAARWGNGNGIYNYQVEADRLLNDMKNRALITGQTVKGVMTAGALFETNNHLVRFTPNVADWNHTDPSYQLPAFYEVWAKCGPSADREFWAQAAQASREFFQRAAHPLTSLTPDYANFDGTPWAAPWKPDSVDFRFDAWRTAMNWSVDWAWWAKDPREQILSERLLTFFQSQDGTNYANQFTLAGQPLSPDHSTGLVAMNAVAALAASEARGKIFVERLWNAPVPSGTFRYYDGMIYLMGLLHCSGEFRAWQPK